MSPKSSDSPRQSLHALPHRTVLHDYIIESELGSGGFSIVYLARHHLNPDWLYAIKEFLPGELAVRTRDGATVRPVNAEAQEAFEDGLRRFRDEAEQLRNFRNEPCIVSCLNYFERNGTAYLVMDYDDGLPLSEFLRHREAAGQPFTEADLRAVVEPLLEGMRVVHRAGVLHRDIKPGNIFVRRPDDIAGRPAQPVLIDFGAAKQNYLSHHSRSLAPYTPGYAAYEQVSSMGDIGPWTDVYALGALMWRMVAGGCPGDPRLHMPDDSMDGIAWNPTPRAVEKRSYSLHSRQPDPMVPAVKLGAGRFSPSLLAAIDACLVLMPEHRVRSCEELRRLIEQAESKSTGSRKESIHNEPVGNPASASAKQSNGQLDVKNDLNGDRRAEGRNELGRILRTVTGRLNEYGWLKKALPYGDEHRQHTESPPVKRRKATFWRVPSFRTLGVTAVMLAAISLAATYFLRIPLTPEQAGPTWSERNPLIAAIRQHNSLLNLTGLAYEHIQFDEDPIFDRDDLGSAMRADMLANNCSYSDICLGAIFGAYVRARSLSEYEYLSWKSTQETLDSRKLVRYAGGLGILVAIAVVILDPTVFFITGALVVFALRRGLFATRRAALWGAGIGAFGCASIVAVQEALLHIAQDFRTLDYSMASVFIGALLGGSSLGLIGAFTSHRSYKSAATIQDVSFWRVPSIRTLGVTAVMLAAMSLAATYFLRIPLTPEQVGPTYYERSPLIAAIRQHNSLLNLTGLAYEYIQFDEDPSFDRTELIRALEADNRLNVTRISSVGYVSESVLDQIEEGYQVDLEELIRVIEAGNSRSNIRIFAQARSMSEYEYLSWKSTQETLDSRKLVRAAGGLGILAAIAVVILDPTVFFVTGALVVFALRRGLFATRRAALWGAGIGAFGCASIVTVQETLLHIAQDFRTLDYSMASVLIGALLGGFSLGLVGAFSSRRSYKSVATMQDASIRAGAVCGLSAPVLQLVFARLGIAYDFPAGGTLSLVFWTFVIVALFHLLLGGIRFFAARKEWLVYMIALGELQAHSGAMRYTNGPDEYLAAALMMPLLWIPSGIGLELIFRLFDSLNLSIVQKRYLQAAILLLVGYITWIVLGGLTDVIP